MLAAQHCTTRGLQLSSLITTLYLNPPPPPSLSPSSYSLSLSLTLSQHSDVHAPLSSTASQHPACFVIYVDKSQGRRPMTNWPSREEVSLVEYVTLFACARTQSVASYLASCSSVPHMVVSYDRLQGQLIRTLIILIWLWCALLLALSLYSQTVWSYNTISENTHLAWIYHLENG